VNDGLTTDTAKPKCLCENPVSVPLLALQIPHELFCEKMKGNLYNSNVYEYTLLDTYDDHYMCHIVLNIQRQRSEVMSVERVSLYCWIIKNWLLVQVAAASTSTTHERAVVVLLQGCVKLAITQQLPCMECHWHQGSLSQLCRSFRTCCSKLSSKSASKKHHINSSKNISKCLSAH
jgi:hypothetical protein